MLPSKYISQRTIIQTEEYMHVLMQEMYYCGTGVGESCAMITPAFNPTYPIIGKCPSGSCLLTSARQC